MSNTNGDKLQDYLRSVPISSLALAINTILGSLIVQCTGDELDVAITVTKEVLAEEGAVGIRSPRPITARVRLPGGEVL